MLSYIHTYIHTYIQACINCSEKERGERTYRRSHARQPIVEDVTWAARSAEDRLQSGSADARSPQHVHAGVLSSPNPGSTTLP